MFDLTGSGNIATVEAAPGLMCKVNGPTSMRPGDTVLYSWRIEDNVEDVFDPFIEDRFWADINDEYGKARIVATLQDVADGGELAWKFADADDYEEMERKRVDEIAIVNPNDIDSSLLNLLKSEFGFEMESNPCGDGVESIVDYCISEGTCTVFDNADNDEIQAWIDAMNEGLAEDFYDMVIESDDDPYCEYIEQEFGREAFLDAGGSNSQADDIDQWWFETCDLTYPLNPDGEIGPILDDLGFFAVTCFEAGEFTVTLGDRSQNDRVKFSVSCFDDPDRVDILANPSSVEVVPALGNTAHSLIQVFIYTEDDGPVPHETEVQFIVDRCAIETEGVNSLEERDDALDKKIGPSGLPLTADEWEEFANQEEPDDKPLYDVFELEDTEEPGVLQIDSEDDDDSTLPDRSEALAIFHADLGTEHSGKCSPGPVKITVAVEVEDDPDIVVSFTLDVVGPPASVAVSAEQTSVRCGELIRMKATIKDSVGQEVSDHTLAEVVTNYGGVLGGTGAVAGQQGLTTPLSSTVAETFDGIATFYLLTSNQQPGPYEVLVSSGGGGSVADQRLGGLFSTPVQTGRVVVSCSGEGPAAPVLPSAPAVTAPSTGQGITPPNTGDAGLLH